MKFLKPILCLGILLVFQSMSAQNLLTNPSFSTNLNGWAVSGNLAHDAICSGVVRLNGNDLPANGILSQDFVSVIGTNYQVAVDFAGHTTSQIIQLEIYDNANNQTVLSQVLTSSGGACFSGFDNFTATFTAPSADLKIRFTDLSTATFQEDLFLGEASVQSVAPVPTVSQWGLIMLGLLVACLGGISIWKFQYRRSGQVEQG